jgi:hypothetical protein
MATVSYPRLVSSPLIMYQYGAKADDREMKEKTSREELEYSHDHVHRHEHTHFIVPRSSIRVLKKRRVN